MYLTQPFIRGKQYEWSDIALFAMNQVFTGITNIEYEEDQDMKNVMAVGKEVAGRVYGQMSPTAKVSMLMSDIEALQAASPTGRIQDIPEFTIVVSYLDPALLTVVHKLNNVRFKKNGRKSGTGEGAIMHDIELIISDIKWK